LNCNPSNKTVSSDDNESFWFKIDVTGFAISFVALSFVGVVILSDKRIRTHPNQMIAYICLSDAYNYCQILSRYIYCGYELNIYLDQLFSYSVLTPLYYIYCVLFGADKFHEISFEQLIEDRNASDGVMLGSTGIRLSSWYFFSIMASYISLFFSTSIILDLYSVLKNPFSSTEARIKKMTIIALILSFSFSAICLRLTISDNDIL
jgi:hypothetical protein